MTCEAVLDQRFAHAPRRSRVASRTLHGSALHGMLAKRFRVIVDSKILFVGYSERMRRKHHILRHLVRGILPETLTVLLLLILTRCNNNPYPAGERQPNLLSIAPYRTIQRRSIPASAMMLPPGVSSIISYPSYMQYNYLKRDPFVVELSLGAEEPKRERVAVTITEDGKTITKQGERWTFRIKKGLHFQDDPCFPGGKGREILAAHFLYTFRRLADPAVPCPIIQYFDDKVLGMAAYKAHNAALLKQQQPSDHTFPFAVWKRILIPTPFTSR